MFPRMRGKAWQLSSRDTQYKGSMAWRCSGKTNEELVKKMVDAKLLKSSVVAEAFRKVDRRHYVPNHHDSYQDSPQLIGFNATISAPHMHASACENLLPFLGRGKRVLDVGSGSGYLTAVLHHLCPGGLVLGIDHLPGLVQLGRRNLEQDGVTLGLNDLTGVDVILGDGRKGSPEHAPFDAIHVGAAATRIPVELIEQLAQPGRLFIPVGPEGGSQDIWQVDKLEDGSVHRQCLYGVRYVPLTDAHRQWAE